MLRQQLSLIDNSYVKTELFLATNSTDISLPQIDLEVRSLDVHQATEEGIRLVESLSPKSQTFDEHDQAFTLRLEPNFNGLEKVLMVGKLALSIKIGKAKLHLLVSQILEKKSNKLFLLIASRFDEPYTLLQDKEEKYHSIDTSLLEIQHKSVSLIFTLHVDSYGYILRYSAFNDALEQIAFKTLRFINSIELKGAIEQPDQNLNTQSYIHSQTYKFEATGTKWKDKAQAFQTHKHSLFPLSSLMKEFFQRSTKYKSNNRSRLFSFRLIPLLALTIVLGFFAHKQIRIERLRNTVDNAKGQTDNSTRMTALQELLKLGEPLNNIPLHSANLPSANLAGANLNGAFFDRANLSGAFLYRANLNGANLYKVNLSGANLNGTNLSATFLNSANLNSASLNGAFLSGAFLERANLNGAKLVSANLNGAKLVSANLDRANLNGAKLVSANLDSANLNGAKLEGANLYGANLNNAQFGCIKSYTNKTVCTNLSNARNLTPEQVKQAKNWQIGIYDPQFRKKLGLPS